MLASIVSNLNPKPQNPQLIVHLEGFSNNEPSLYGNFVLSSTTTGDHLVEGHEGLEFLHLGFRISTSLGLGFFCLKLNAYGSVLGSLGFRF